MTTNISVYSSTPRVIYRGIKDEGARPVAMPVESVPIRFPLLMSFSPFGSYDDPQAVNGSSIELTHGIETIQPQSKFFTHQSVFMRSHFTGGGSGIFLRLRADGAAMASARIGIDLVEDELITYERNSDGSYRRNNQGELVPTGEVVVGIRSQWRVIQVPEIDGVSDFGRGKPMEGSMVSSIDGAASTFYPIVDVLGRWEGDLYNNFGFRMFAPSALDREALDPALVERLDARPYRMQIVRRDNANATPSIFPTQKQEHFVNFTFVDAIDTARGTKEYNLQRIWKETYESEKPEEFVGYGPFSDLHVYQDHVETILNQLIEAETSHTGDAHEGSIHRFNFLTGSDVDEIPYYTYRVEGPRDGGVLLTETSSHFMSGGNDGDVSNEALNRKWSELLGSLTNSHIPFEDVARMPYDSVFDSGFPLETKLKFTAFHNLRPDVYPHVCTQDVLLPLNTPSEDTSVLLTLRSTFRSMIESPEFGTKATRFALFNCAGYFPEDDYKGLVPFMEYIVNKGAAYMGAANGKMNSNNAFGRGEENVVTRYIRHNAGLKKINARNSDWNNGVNYPEFYDMKRLFYPGLQSIYEDHTSPLHSYFNVQICCNQTRIGHVIWRELAGDDRMDDDVFLTEVERRFKAKTHEVYDNRTIATPRAYYTELDTTLGTHWHLDAENQFKNIKTTQTLAIIAQRTRTGDE